jgi:hypothetical protein
MKSKKKGYRFVAFSCGYVESSMTSTLVYGTPFLGNKKFATRGEAITELALDLYAKFVTDRAHVSNLREKPKACCQEAEEQKHNFCSKCGRPILTDEFDAEAFKEFIVELHNTDCDSYGDAEWFEGRDPEFWPWSFSELLEADKSEVVYIAENAEHVLLAALCDAKPELRQYVEPDFSERDWEEQFKLDKQPSYR